MINESVQAHGKYTIIFMHLQLYQVTVYVCVCLYMYVCAVCVIHLDWKCELGINFGGKLNGQRTM